MTQPFVKWAGGKRQILPAILSRLPTEIVTYYEPFVGGGAVFFALAHEGAFDRAVINDLNSELMDSFRTFGAGGVQGVIDLLSTYPHERGFFEDLRRLIPAELSLEARTARFIYLNRIGFNGLYRVNKKGQFNVPFGQYENPTICDESNLRAVAKVLVGVEAQCQDFAVSVEPARPGDTVYFDPPYIPLSETSNFTAYTEGGFGLREHERLARCFRQLAERGVSVLLSNSDTERSRELYDGFKVEQVKARRNINSKGTKRGEVSELLVSANLPDQGL